MDRKRDADGDTVLDYEEIITCLYNSYHMYVSEETDSNGDGYTSVSERNNTAFEQLNSCKE